MQSKLPLVSAYFNLFIAAAGAGLLSYPRAVAWEGIVTAICTTAVFAVLNGYTGCALATMTHSIRHNLATNNYAEAVEIKLRSSPDTKLGRFLASPIVSSALPLATLLIGCLGSAIGYFIVIGDTGGEVLREIAPNISVESARAIMTFGFAVFVAFPLGYVRRIHNLWISSALAAFTIFALGLLVVVEGAQSISENDGLVPAQSGSNSTVTDYVRPTLVQSDASLLLGVPITIFSLGNHLQVVNIFLDLPLPLVNKFHVPVIACAVSCFMLYLSTGIFGYLAFGEGVHSDILVDFPLSNPFATAAKVLIVIHIALAMPVVTLPCREAFHILWSSLKTRFTKRSRQLSRDDSREAMLPQPQNQGNIHSNSRLSWLFSSLENAGIILGTATVAVVFPQLSLVFGLLGATVSVSQIYVFPAFMMLAHALSLRQGSQGTPQPLLPYTPTSAYWLTRQAAVLCVIAVVVGVVGTVVTIKESF